MAAANRTLDRARDAVEHVTAAPTPAPATPAPATRAPATPAPASAPAAPAGGIAGIDRETTVDEAASALADELMRIPGIQRFGDMRLRDLDATGPRPLRTMWRIARDQLDSRYGDLTIGQVIDQYRGSGGVSAGA